MARANLRFLAGIALALAVSLGGAAPAFAVVPSLNQPSWGELSPEQQTILAPLREDWASLEVYRRKKWIGIAQRYPAMSPEEQARVKQRMSDWAKLSPEQRRSARDSYKSMKQAPAEQKAAMPQKWQEYLQLPEEEKKRLQSEAARKSRPKPVTGKHPIAPKQVISPPASEATPMQQESPPAPEAPSPSSQDSTQPAPPAQQ